MALSMAAISASNEDPAGHQSKTSVQVLWWKQVNEKDPLAVEFQKAPSVYITGRSVEWSFEMAVAFQKPSARSAS